MELSTADRQWKRFTGAVIVCGVALLALVVAYHAAFTRCYVVPEQHRGLVVYQRWLWGKRFGLLGPGEHNVTNLKKTAEVFAIPVGTRTVPFLARLVGSPMARAADRLDDKGISGWLKKHVDINPILVEGTLTLDITDHAVLAMAEAVQGTPFVPNFAPILLKPLVATLNKHHDLHTTPQYRVRVEETLREQLVRYHFGQVRVAIAATHTVEKTTEESEGKLTSQFLSAAPPLQSLGITAKVVYTIFLQTFVITLVVLLGLLVFFLKCPEEFLSVFEFLDFVPFIDLGS